MFPGDSQIAKIESFPLAIAQMNLNLINKKIIWTKLIFISSYDQRKLKINMTANDNNKSHDEKYLLSFSLRRFLQVSKQLEFFFPAIEL